MSSDEPINSGETAESEGKNDDWYRERAKETLLCGRRDRSGQ